MGDPIQIYVLTDRPPAIGTCQQTDRRRSGSRRRLLPPLSPPLFSRCISVGLCLSLILAPNSLAAVPSPDPTRLSCRFSVCLSFYLSRSIVFSRTPRETNNVGWAARKPLMRYVTTLDIWLFCFLFFFVLSFFKCIYVAYGRLVSLREARRANPFRANKFTHNLHVGDKSDDCFQDADKRRRKTPRL